MAESVGEIRDDGSVRCNVAEVAKAFGDKAETLGETAFRLARGRVDYQNVRARFLTIDRNFDDQENETARAQNR